MDFIAGETKARTHPRTTTYEKPDPDPRPVLPAIPAAAGDDFQVPFTLVERKSLEQIFWGNQFFMPLDHVMCDLHRHWGRESESLQKHYFKASTAILPKKTSHLPYHRLMGWIPRMHWDRVEKQSKKGTEHTGLRKTHDFASPLLPGCHHLNSALVQPR